uniref:Uncharacterized protein n=1 Tax=Trichogramma kaykai TaxID=54128 RepID=A0ABD2XEV5_9HYME
MNYVKRLNRTSRNRVVGMASELSRWSDTRAHASAMDTRYNLLLLSANELRPPAQSNDVRLFTLAASTTHRIIRITVNKKA